MKGKSYVVSHRPHRRALVVWLSWWLSSKGRGIKWYEWILGIIGLALLLFTIQNFFGSQAGLEPKAANMFLLATGLPALILLVLTGVLILADR